MTTLTKKQIRTLLVNRQGLSKRLDMDNNFSDLLKNIGCIQIDPVSVVTPNLNIVCFNRLFGYTPNDYRKGLVEGQCTEYFSNAMCAIHEEYRGGLSLIKRQKLIERGQDRSRFTKECDYLIDVVSEEPKKALDISLGQSIDNNWSGLDKRKLSSYLLELLVDLGEVEVVDRLNSHKVYKVSQAHKEVQDPYGELFSLYLRSRTLIPFNRKIMWLKGHKEEFEGTRNELINRGCIDVVKYKGKSYIISSLDSDDAFETVEHLRFLSPLDNMLWDRKLTSEIFEYDYKWEIYTPKNKRVNGPYSMPILFNGNIIGEVSFEKTKETIGIKKGRIIKKYLGSKILTRQFHIEIKRLGKLVNREPILDVWSAINETV